jgi:hypothetical protein
MRCSIVGLLVATCLGSAVQAEGSAALIESLDARQGWVMLRIANAAGPITVRLVGYEQALQVVSMDARNLTARLPLGLADGSYRLRIEGIKRDEPQEAAFTIGVIGPFLDDKR